MMSAEETVADLRRQLQAKTDDSEELKLDKRDLRSHMAKLREELEATTTALTEELNVTRAELQEVRMENEELRRTIQGKDEWLIGDKVATNSQAATVTALPLDRRPSKPQNPESSTHNAAALNQVVKVRSPSIEIIEPTTMPSISQAKGKRKAVTADGPPHKRTRPARTVTVASPLLYPSSAPKHSVVPEYILDRPRVRVLVDRAFVLPLDVLSVFLKDVPPISIVPGPSSLLILRQLLHTAYGCSPRQNVQYIESARNPSKRCLRVLVLPRHDVHPSMPLLPGHSGLIVAGRYNPPPGESPYSLFRKDIKGSSTWLYMGEYEWSVAGQMSAAVFRGQTEEVKQGLASEIVTPKKNTSEYYLSMRARIALRKGGFLPTDNKDLEKELVRQEMLRLNTGRPSQLTQEDVIFYLSRGEEAIDLILLRCVSYDRVFANDLEAKWRASRRKGGRPRGPRNNSNTVKRPNSPIARSRQAASSIQPGTYSSGMASASTLSYGHHWATSVLDSNDSLNPRPVRGMRSTWDPETGQRVRHGSDAIPMQTSREVIDLVQDGDPKDVEGLNDVIMSDFEDDGSLSYVSAVTRSFFFKTFAIG